jgi:uncharacterized RDD family membrane protein YckC
MRRQVGLDGGEQVDVHRVFDDNSYAAGLLYGPTRFPRAPLGRRTAAFLVDSAILLAFAGPGVALLSAVAFAGLNKLELGQAAPGAALVALGLAYFVVKDGLFRGASVGKYAFGLAVVEAATGRPCGVGRAALRAAVTIAISFLPYVGVLAEPVIALISSGGRRIGDHAAGTQVVRRGASAV